jgi:hypothetical protein
MTLFPCKDCITLVLCMSNRPIEHKAIFIFKTYTDILVSECPLLRDYIWVGKDKERKRHESATFYLKGYQ